jgi:hypothetical protein
VETDARGGKVGRAAPRREGGKIGIVRVTREEPRGAFEIGAGEEDATTEHEGAVGRETASAVADLAHAEGKR